MPLKDWETIGEKSRKLDTEADVVEDLFSSEAPEERRKKKQESSEGESGRTEDHQGE